jgi:hypothetical protein
VSLFAVFFSIGKGGLAMKKGLIFQAENWLVIQAKT